MRGDGGIREREVRERGTGSWVRGLLLGILCLGVCSQAEVQAQGMQACGNGTCEPAKGESCSTCARDCRCALGQTCNQGVCASADGDAAKPTAPGRPLPKLPSSGGRLRLPPAR